MRTVGHVFRVQNMMYRGGGTKPHGEVCHGRVRLVHMHDGIAKPGLQVGVEVLSKVQVRNHHC